MEFVLQPQTWYIDPTEWGLVLYALEHLLLGAYFSADYNRELVFKLQETPSEIKE